MANDQLVLHINKVLANIDKDQLRYNSDERGKGVDVTVIDTDNSAYDLTGKTIRYCEQKDNGKVIIDQEGDDNDSGNGGKFTVGPEEEQKAGHFTYNFSKLVYQKSGNGWFEFVTDANNVDITNKFAIDIEQATELDVNNDNYISSLEAETSSYQANLKLLNDTRDNLQQTINSDLDAFKQNLDQINQQWQAQTAKIQQDANAQIEAANNAAKDQRDSEASTFNSTLQDQIKQIQDQRDAAIQQANDAYQQQRNDLQTAFNQWQADNKAQWEQTLSNIQQHVDQLQNTDLPGMDQKVADLKEQLEQAEKDAADATAKFNSIDITKYEQIADLKANYYDKPTVDQKLSQAGKLKTVSLNKGMPVQPDANGNADLTVPQPDLSAYETKDDAEALKNTLGWKTVDSVNVDTITYTSKLFITKASGVPENNGGWGFLITEKGYDDNNSNIRITQEWWSDRDTSNYQTAKHYYRQVTSNDETWCPWLAQATQDDVTALQGQITSLGSEITNLKQNTPTMVACTLAEYDALSSKDPNTIYMIGG